MKKYAGMLIVLMASTMFAQTVSKKSLTLDGAEKVIAASKAEAARLKSPGGVIAVVDDGGNLMALARLDNTFAAGANISIGKARTAVLFKKPTKVFEDIVKNGRTSMVALNDFTPLQGGVPIVVEGEIVGAVGVSGAASAQQDEELAIAGANAFSGKAAAVKLFREPDVEAAFAKGAVLFDGEGGNYMIHASRRHALTARVSATAPGTGTHLIASYQWADNRWAVTPGHLYSTQNVRPVPGLNLFIRQPIPNLASLPWRMEATADLRNLLAQGYLPLGLADGRQVLLMQTPRSFRGGLSFIF